MTEDQILKVIGHLPEEQRSEARLRIERAIANKITDIGLWTGNEPADISDLVGNDAKDLIEFHLGEDKWMHPRLIFLAEYKS